MLNALLLFAWLLAVVYASIPLYWFITHPLARFWRTQRKPLYIVAALWFVMIGLLLLLTYPFHELRLYNEWEPWVLALPLALIALYIYRHVTGSSFDRATLLGQTEMEAHREQKLYTGGLHARMRHPIYLAHLLHLSYWTIATGIVVNYILLILSLPLYALMIGLEERELVARFGDDYRAYQRRVPALIPRLRS